MKLRTLGGGLLAALALAGCTEPAFSRAANPAEAFRQANAELRARLATENATTSPAADLATHGPLVRQAFDVAILSSSEAQDFAALNGWCAEVADTMDAYSMAGAPADVLPDIAQGYAGINAIAYEAELALATRFSIACIATSVTMVDELVRTSPSSDLTAVRRMHAQRLRDEAAGIYVDVILSATGGGIAPETVALFRETAQRAPAFAAIMTPTQRATVVAIIDEISPGLERRSIKSHLAAVRAAVAAEGCTGLCGL